LKVLGQHQLTPKEGQGRRVRETPFKATSRRVSALLWHGHGGKMGLALTKSGKAALFGKSGGNRTEGHRNHGREEKILGKGP